MNDKSILIRVVIFSPLPPPEGGIASWTEKYLEWMEKKDIKHTLLNSSVTGKRAKQINSKISVLDEIRRTLNIFRNTINIIRSFKPNIIHINTSCSNRGLIRDYIVALLMKRRQVRIITNYRCNISDQIGNRKFVNFILKKLAKISSSNIVLNTSSYNFLHSNGIQKINILPNFIDESILLNDSKKINNNITKVIFVGHVQITKGIIEIIKAANALQNITFTIIGPISNEVENYSTSSNIVLFGPISDKKSIINMLDESDVFLFPSYTEGFSNALLEAMARGLPIISTSVGANFEMIESFGGVIIPTKDSDAIVRAINLINNSSSRELMSKWNVKKVKEYYLIDGVMEALIDIYVDVLGENIE